MTSQSRVAQKIYSTDDAASYLGTTSASLRKSRVTGELWGLPAPRYRKTGHRCLYLLAELDAFIDAIPTASSTTEARIARQLEVE